VRLNLILVVPTKLESRQAMLKTLKNLSEYITRCSIVSQTEDKRLNGRWDVGLGLIAFMALFKFYDEQKLNTLLSNYMYRKFRDKK